VEYRQLQHGFLYFRHSLLVIGQGQTDNPNSMSDLKPIPNPTYTGKYRATK